jgi:hypothetical protein
MSRLKTWEELIATPGAVIKDDEVHLGDTWLDKHGLGILNKVGFGNLVKPANSYTVESGYCLEDPESKWAIAEWMVSSKTDGFQDLYNKLSE